MTKMAKGTQSVQLTEAQSRYLEALQANAGLPAGLRLNGLVLEGSPNAIEALREKLTQLLAERGFAEDYSATAEGDLIEDLIDALHLNL
jgi:hypothetical protein